MEDQKIAIESNGQILWNLKDPSECFLVGKNSEIYAFKSGRLFLGINDDNTHDNEGLYRVRIQSTPF